METESYDTLIAAADEDRDRGRYKEAHIQYGNAVSVGGPRDHYCRQMRGICSRLVAEERMQLAIDHPDERQDYLDQTARWLAKSEANLDAAFEVSPDDELGPIRLEQAKTEEAMARFMEMCGSDPRRRLSVAETFRAEALQLLGRT